MPEIGALLGGKYRLLRLVGEGGMGAVYEAEHERIGKRVAIKVVTTSLSRDPSLSARLEREARAAAATGHRGVIDIYDVGEDTDGALFLVMELLQGESLGQLLSRSAPLHVTFVAGVALQILSALDAVHDRGILHRDLKPDNVFLLPSGGSVPDVKLLDFGLSKGTAGLARERITTTGTVMGTPAYMAPEQLLGRAELDRRVDVYSMGVILYECLTGVLPFDGETVHLLVDRALHDRVRPPRELRPELPADLEAVILKALSRKRDDRTESALVMARALAPFADGEQVRRAFPSNIVAGPSGDIDLSSAPTVPENQTLRAAVRAATASGRLEWSWRRGGLLAAIAVAIVVGVLTGLLLLGPEQGQARSPAGSAPAANEGLSPASPPNLEAPPAQRKAGHAPGSSPLDRALAIGSDAGPGAGPAKNVTALGDAGPHPEASRDSSTNRAPRAQPGRRRDGGSSPSATPREPGAQDDVFGFDTNFGPHDQSPR